MHAYAYICICVCLFSFLCREIGQAKLGITPTMCKSVEEGEGETETETQICWQLCTAAVVVVVAVVDNSCRAAAISVCICSALELSSLQIQRQQRRTCSAATFTVLVCKCVRVYMYVHMHYLICMYVCIYVRSTGISKRLSASFSIFVFVFRPCCCCFRRRLLKSPPIESYSPHFVRNFTKAHQQNSLACFFYSQFECVCACVHSQFAVAEFCADVDWWLLIADWLSHRNTIHSLSISPPTYMCMCVFRYDLGLT